MEKNHIIISGDRKVNKTSFVMELMEKIHRPKYGFITDMSEVDEKGFHDIYIHRAGVPKDKWCYKEENRIGDCDTRQHNVKPEIFEGLGVYRHKWVAAAAFILGSAATRRLVSLQKGGKRDESDDSYGCKRKRCDFPGWAGRHVWNDSVRRDSCGYTEGAA